MTRRIRVAILVGALVPALAAGAAAQTPSPLDMLHVRGNIYVLFGAGGNITLSERVKRLSTPNFQFPMPKPFPRELEVGGWELTGLFTGSFAPAE